MFILADRVQETATANTTVSFTLSGAMTSYQSFAAIGNGNTTYYGATDGTNWEVGFGTYSTSPNTLTRTTIFSSSNSGSAVTFSGTVTVWVDYPAGKQISSDYPNALGVVTPAAGTFTTITGQTEVLKGTGQNLALQSENFGTTWTSGGTAGTGITLNATTSPTGTSNAGKLYELAATGTHTRTQAITASNVPLTFSVYLKAAERFRVRLDMTDLTTGDAIQDFNLTTGALVGSVNIGGSWTNGSAAITSVGNGWYRCSVTATKGSYSGVGAQIYMQDDSGAISYTGNGTSGFYVWGAQLEVASTAGTYLATTTTAIYGTPTLSFSGVAGLGLQSDGSLYVSPAGTGALQAQATTSSTVGGNARGANAVDWQTGRGGATQVASGSNAFIGGGYGNTVSNSFSAIGGGGSNVVNQPYASILGGQNNTATLNYSAVVGGYSNNGTGYYGLVGGGASNSTTSSSAVTTQSATMNGTTTVTLAASNANIKVGQLITGTYITFPTTYVAAISGTTLTLNQVASGSGTATLSFYTPHGVVVGGGNNQATGSYSFIGGGGDAGTAANRNVASGDWSFVGGGVKNVASGLGSVVCGGGIFSAGSYFSNTASNIGSFVGGGTNNTANNVYSSVVGGLSNTASGYASFVYGGDTNTASGSYSSLLTGTRGTTRAINGNATFSSTNPISATTGITQASLIVLARQTTDATPTVLASDASAAGSTNQVILPNNSAYYFTGTCIANVTGAAAGAAWDFSGAIMRGAGVGTTVLIGTPMLNRVAVSSGASAWSIAITADTTNGGLAITFTGQVGTTIRVVAKVETTEVTF
jgi:hypothetical protein